MLEFHLLYLKKAPTKKPPIPRKLITENTNINVPQVTRSEVRVLSIIALARMTIPDTKATNEAIIIKLCE